MSFTKIEKRAGRGEMSGAIVRASKSRKELAIILGQDVIKKFDLSMTCYMEIHIGEDRDAGKLLLVPGSKQNGYRLQIDSHGKGRMQVVKPLLVTAFCNGHSRIECTVVPHEHGVLLCGNNRR